MRLYLRYSFELVTLLCSYLLFYLNIYHRSEQTIYNEIYSPLALELSSFKYSITDQVMDSYPMWGYPIVISIFQNNETLVLLFHFLLLLISSIIFFNYSHNFINSKIIKGLVGILFIFYSLTISVKWPDAVLVFLLFIFCFFHSKKYFLFATISLALAYNFRSEALIFLLIYSTYLIINKKKIHLLALLFLLPWNVLQYISNNKIVLTSSNSGSVLYITLGQLKDNIWNIEHSDNFAKEKVFEYSRGKISDPWGLDANQLMKNKFIDSISKHPVEFLRKILVNFKSSITGGFYSGELHHHESVGDEILNYKKDKLLIAKHFIELKYSALLVVISSILRITSILVLVYSIFFIFYKFRIEILKNVLFLIILSQFVVTWFIHYQPRHISHIIPPLIFMLILVKTEKDINNKKVTKNIG